MSFVFIHSNFFPDWWFNTFSSFSPDSVPLSEALLQSCTTRPNYNLLVLVIILSVGQISCLVCFVSLSCQMGCYWAFCFPVMPDGLLLSCAVCVCETMFLCSMIWHSWAVSALMVCYWSGLHGSHQVMFCGISLVYWMIVMMMISSTSLTPPPCWIFCECNSSAFYTTCLRWIMWD
jgi:hypothetical protein